MKILTPCAFCRIPIEVGFWNYLPSKPPRDVYCPQCGGRNNINRKSIFLAAATTLPFIWVGIELAETQGTKGGAVVVLLTAMVAGIWPAAFLGSRIPGLIKYSMLWTRPTEPPSESDRALMDEHGVTHNGEYFIVGDVHFDHLKDAVAYVGDRSSR